MFLILSLSIKGTQHRLGLYEGFAASTGSGQPAHPCFPINIFILMYLKLTMYTAIFKAGKVHFTNMGGESYFGKHSPYKLKIFDIFFCSFLNIDGRTKRERERKLHKRSKDLTLAHPASRTACQDVQPCRVFMPWQHLGTLLQSEVESRIHHPKMKFLTMQLTEFPFQTAVM